MIRVENVSKSFGSKKALHQISFEIQEGEIFGFLGPSGSGKTTMINVLTGQLAADQGETVLLGKSSRNLTSNDLEQIGIVSDTSGFYEKMNLYKNLLIYAKLYGLKASRVDTVLDQVGLSDAKNIIAEKLSTGMKQRMFLARALLNAPKILFLDEPISALDVSVRAQVLNLLKKFQKELGLTYLFIAHDLSVVRFISDRIAVIYKGVIVEVAETEELFNNPVHPYTQALLSAVPIPDPILERKKVLKVYDPDQHDYETDKPSMVEIRPGHYVWANQAELARYKKALKE